MKVRYTSRFSSVPFGHPDCASFCIRSGSDASLALCYLTGSALRGLKTTNCAGPNKLSFEAFLDSNPGLQKLTRTGCMLGSDGRLPIHHVVRSRLLHVCKLLRVELDK